MPQKSTNKILSHCPKNTERVVKRKTEKKTNNVKDLDNNKLYPNFVPKNQFHNRTIQTYCEQGNKKRLQVPVNSPSDGVDNYITTNMLIPDTEESLVKYLEWIYKAREAKEKEKLKKEKRKNQSRFTLKNKKKDENTKHNNVPINNNVKKRDPQKKTFHSNQKFPNSKIPIPIKEKQDRELQKNQRHVKRKSSLSWRLTGSRSPFKCDVADSTKKIKKPASKLQPEKCYRNKFGSPTHSAKSGSKQRKVRERNTRVRSPPLQRKVRSPLSAVSRWFPLSVNGHTKPYYEAWLDSELQPGIYSSKQETKLPPINESKPHLSDLSWGTIRVRR